MPYTVRKNHNGDHEQDTWFCRSRKDNHTPCTNGAILQRSLKTACAEALGRDEFDDAAFEAYVKCLTVTPNGDIDIELVGGKVHHWKNWHLDDNYPPVTSTDAFLQKIRCSMCGDLYHRYNSRWVYWYCMGKKKSCRCANINYADFLLRQVSAMLMGIDEFDEQVFLEQVDFIEAAADQTLIYHFKDGRTAQWQKR